MSYPYEILKNGENDMKEVKALQGCSHLKASRRNMNQEKWLSEKEVEWGKRYQRWRKFQEVGDSKLDQMLGRLTIVVSTNRPIILGTACPFQQNISFESYRIIRLQRLWRRNNDNLIIALGIWVITTSFVQA